MGTTVGAYAEQSVSRLPPSPRTQYYALPYRPTPANQNILAYNGSSNRGVRVLTDLLRDRFRRCPGIRIGLIGYSQGADVIDSTLLALTIEERGIIRSVLLLGAPNSAGESSYSLTVNLETGARVRRTGSGVLPDEIIPSDLQGVTTDFCIATDAICDNLQNSFSEFGRVINNPIHQRYADCCGSISLPRELGIRFGDRLREA